MPTDSITVISAALARGAAIRPPIGGFPVLAEVLRQAGVQRYAFDVPSASGIYTTADGVVLQAGTPLRSGLTEIAPFDEAALVTALRIDQQGRSSFPEFVAASLAAGVVRYVVDTAERTCTYLGARGERYVEDYPAVDLPPEDADR